MTSRSAAVTLALAALVGLAAPLWGEDPVDADRELRLAMDRGRPPEARWASAERALGADGGEPAIWLRAAAHFGMDATDLGVALLRRAFLEGAQRPVEDPKVVADPERRANAEAAWRRTLAEVQREGDAARAARMVAARYLFGDALPDGMLEPWPPAPVLRAVLEDDFGRVHDARGTAPLAGWDEEVVKALVAEHGPTALLLSQACSLHLPTSTKALDALLALGPKAVPLLLHEVRRAAEPVVPPGRVDRCTKAIAVLGLIGDRSATEPLMACLLSNEGWIRAAAATALGDLGDPKAAVALARQLAYAGDPFRARESWDYPGTTETTVKPEDWNGVEYYAIDAAAADALLALGSPGAVAWLLKNDLDPKRRNLRIRVLQDALDAIHRHLPEAPTAGYNPDAGLPQRHAAFEALEAWWRANRHHPYLLKKTFDEQDPGWVESARGLARRLGEPKVLELMIAKDSCEILGHVITPVLVEALGAAKTASHKNELAQALARVRDRRAVPALLLLLGEKAGFVRAAALGSLGVYARDGAHSVVAALVAALDDPDCGAQVAAMQALASAPPSAEVRAAIARHGEAAYEARCGADAGYTMALTVVRLVQEGEAHWPKVRDGLRSKGRVERRSWWDLLRNALDLYEHLHDPVLDPGSPDWRPIDEAKVLDALRARRGER